MTTIVLPFRIDGTPMIIEAYAEEKIGQIGSRNATPNKDDVWLPDTFETLKVSAATSLRFEDEAAFILEKGAARATVDKECTFVTLPHNCSYMKVWRVGSIKFGIRIGVRQPSNTFSSGITEYAVFIQDVVTELDIFSANFDEHTFSGGRLPYGACYVYNDAIASAERMSDSMKCDVKFDDYFDQVGRPL